MAGRKHEIKPLDNEFILITTNSFGHKFVSYFKTEKEAENHRDMLIRLEKGGIR